MLRRSRWRALFVALVAVLAVWMYVRERFETRPLRAPEFKTPAPPDLAPLAATDGANALSGRVRTSAGAPLADASIVVLEARMPRSAQTDRDGAFRVDGLSDGAHELTVLAFGEVPQTFAVTLPRAEPLELVLEPPRAPIETLPAIARATLRGRLRAAAVALDGVELWLEPAEGSDALGGIVPRRARVASDGAFEFEALAAGGYSARVLPAWASGGSWPIVEQREFTWTAEGAALELDYRPATASARVLDLAGRVLPGALVLLRERAVADRPAHAWPARQTDAAGEVRFDDLAGGGYELEIRAGAARNQPLTEFAVAAGERIDLGNIVLTP